MAISLLAANRLYARLGFMATILAYPLLYLLGFTTLALAASFPVLVAFRFAQVAWSEGVSEGANQAMFNLVPPEQREQTRTFVRGVANQVGTSLAGGVLLIGELGMGSRAIFLIGSAAALATTYFVLRASRAYGGAVTEALRAGLPHLFFSEEQPFGGFRQDAAAVQAVIDGITSPEPSVRRVSAEILANLGLPQAAEAAVAALDDEDPAVRAALLRALARAGASGALLEVLPYLHDPAPEVRRQAVEAVRQLSGYPSGAARQIRPLLDDSDPAVRSRAALTLLSAGDNPAARRVLEMMVRSDETPNRLAALEALAEWGDPSAFDLVAARLDDPNPAVRQRAVDAIGQIDAERCLMPLVSALGDEDDKVRQAIAEALGQNRRQLPWKPLFSRSKTRRGRTARCSPWSSSPPAVKRNACAATPTPGRSGPCVIIVSGALCSQPTANALRCWPIPFTPERHRAHSALCRRSACWAIRKPCRWPSKCLRAAIPTSAPTPWRPWKPWATAKQSGFCCPCGSRR